MRSAGALSHRRGKAHQPEHLGYTTARDIAAASGVVSLAAIGYHYGSKEALLNAALRQAMEEPGDDLGRILVAEAGPDTTPEEQKRRGRR